jgi:Ca2+-binding RTX toxin-like protein
LELEGLETRAVPAVSFLNGQLVVNGDDGGVPRSDTMTVRNLPGNGLQVQVVVNGLEQFRGLWSTVLNITVNSLALNDTINVENLAFGVPLTANGGDHDDIVNVGTGNLDVVRGFVTVNGQLGSNTVELHDDQASFSDTYTITHDRVTRSDVFFGELRYGTVQNLILNAQDGNNTIDVHSTASGTLVTINAGDGNDLINLGAANGSGDLNNLPSEIRVNGQGDTRAQGGAGDRLHVNDVDHPNAAMTYVVGPVTLNRAGPFFMRYGTMESLVINAAPSNDTIDVQGTTATTPVTVNANAGNDTLLGPDLVNTWVMNGFNVGTLNGSAVAFNAVENLVGGNTTDRFLFSLGDTLSGSLNGGGGVNDRMDYSALPPAIPVMVDLTAGTANRGVLGAISGIEDVFGGAGNDILIGNAANNLLHGGVGGGFDRLDGRDGHDILVGHSGNDTALGGSGRDLLIGGTGGDVLQGGIGDDILIGGETDFDFNEVALRDIMREWTRTNLFGTPQQQYNQRIAHLRFGAAGGLNTVFLTPGVPAGPGTVIEDGFNDLMTGGGDLDWFWGFAGEITDFNQPPVERRDP